MIVSTDSVDTPVHPPIYTLLHLLLLLLLGTRAEATCTSQIRTAQAFSEDLGEEKAVEKGVSMWAKCREENSERDVHRVIKKQGTTLDIELSFMTIRGTTIPWIDPRDWATWLIKKGLWPRLAGVNRGESEAARKMWSEFWVRFKKLQPHFELFDLEEFGDIDLSRTAAFCLHGDEGRSLKRQGIMVTSLQSILGFGYNVKRSKRNATGKDGLKVNYMGHSFTHRFVSSAIPKSVYENDGETFHGAMEELSKSLKTLLTDGVRDPITNEVFRIAIISVKGDMPYLAKMGRLYRSFNTLVKRGDERRAPKGICHTLLAPMVFQPKRSTPPSRLG